MKNYLLIIIILFYSCDISKQLTKNREKSETETNSNTKTNSQAWDFSTKDVDDYSIELEPLDSKVDMTITTPSGEEIVTKNAKIIRRNKRTKTNNNIKKIDDSEKKEASTVSLETKVKELDKEIKTKTYVMYGLIAIVLLLLLKSFFRGKPP